MFICSAPLTAPLKLPLSEKPPVAVAPPLKHGLVVVKFRLVMFRLPPFICVMFKLKLNTGALLLLELISAAFQFPLIDPLLLSPPHAASTRAAPSISIVQICFTKPPTSLKDELP